MNIQIEFLKDAKEFLIALDEKSKKKILFDIGKTKAGLRGEWFKKMSATDF
jgi:hypothetical protein